jgi:two-component system, NtrC family, sensor kinase
MSIEEHLILYVGAEQTSCARFVQAFGQRFRVSTVGSGAEALEFLKTTTAAVVVVDQRLPDISGNELLKHVRELHPSATRMMITACSELDAVLRAVTEGLVMRYVVKPWDQAEVEEILLWSVEAFDMGLRHSAVQLRLIQMERLVTLGSIGTAVMHDLNQPLAYMLSNSERLKHLTRGLPAIQEMLARHAAELSEEERQLVRDLLEEMPEIVPDMLEGCRLMQTLTGSIRRLVRPSSLAEAKATDPVSVIRYALQVCRETAVANRGSLSYQGPAATPMLSIGTAELSQVMINLLSNAAQALGRRGTPGGRVVVSLTDEGAHSRIAVVDDGPGMPPEVLEKAGTPFFSTRCDGTGLGLAQCRRLIEREHGEFTIDSKVGAGTTASIRLAKVDT